MNYFRNKQGINWAIILLVVIDLGLLGFIYFQYTENQKLMKPETIRQERVKHFMHKQLDLTPEQHEKFRSSGALYFKEMHAISSEINKLKKKLYKEIFSSQPNALKMDQLLESIGKKHADLERKQLEHFQNLKDVCTPEQADKLEEIMKDMVDMMDSRHHMRQMNREHRKFRHRNE